jgi:hypothetical protein
MLDSTPVPLQAILWPLAGAAIILSLGRLLPQWAGRLVALAASIASLAALWSLRGQPPGWTILMWEPLSLFRLGPALFPTPAGLLVGIALCGAHSAGALGIRGEPGQKASWHGWMLVALAGCLLTVLAGNLLTMALGSGLVDLALLAMAVSAALGAGDGQRVAVWMCVPGIASTLLLFVAALQMDTQVGTASVLARQFPLQTLRLAGIAGALRLMIFPVHPRGIRTPRQAVTYLVPAGVGIYLLARVQGWAPALESTTWFLWLGALALLGGGWMAWLGSTRPTAQRLAGSWTGLAAHQAGLAMALAILQGGAVLWSLLSLTAALVGLAIWWDSRDEQPPAAWPQRLLPARQAAEAGWKQASAWLRSRARVPQEWRGSRLAQYATALLPGIGLASMAGLPITLGAISRWHLYGEALREGRAGLLLAAFAADTLLAAALWAVLRAIVRQAGERRPPLPALLAMATLGASTIVLGLAARGFGARLGVAAVQSPGVSAWGLGMLFALSWLLGGWLARASRSHTGMLERALRVASPDRLYRALAWAGQRLVSGVYWLGSVGEGDGWWGWALIILALGALFWAAR